MALQRPLAAGGIVLFVGASSPAVARTWFRVASLAFDVAIVSGFFLSEQIAPPFWIACALVGSGALYVARDRNERVGGEARATQAVLPSGA